MKGLRLLATLVSSSAVGLACGDGERKVGSDIVDARSDAELADISVGIDGVAEVVESPPQNAWGLFEATLDLAVPDGNPFDPQEIAVDVTFTGPGGEVYTMPAFVYKAFERSLVNGREELEASGDREWRVRFRPPFGSPAGAWRWSWRAVTASGVETSEILTFDAVIDPDGRGLVRLSPRDWRYLAHEDGTSYFAVGENMAWYDGRGTYAYDDWMGRLAGQGANYIRLWMPSWAFGLEWTARDSATGEITSNLGDYGARLDRAWKLDYVLDLAASLKTQVMLTLQNHGPFSTIHASEWDRNPYNEANGGPLKRPEEVFTNAEAAELFRRRFRYVVARWGHSPQILAWELWNEFDLVIDVTSPAAKTWTQAMARELMALDPYRHLITTSMGGLELFLARYDDEIPYLNERFDFWDLPEIDLTQVHYYGAFAQPIDFSREIEIIMGHLRRFDKPMLAGEAGVNALGVAETRADDPDGIGFHDILWAGVVAESFGTGMNWWWDEINAPDNYDPQFGAVAAFVAGVAFDREGFERVATDVAVGDQIVFVQALVGTTTVLVWLKDKGNQWFSPLASVIAGFELELALTPDGPRELHWVDPWGVDSTSIQAGEVRDGQLRVEVPAFKRDLALRVMLPNL